HADDLLQERLGLGVAVQDGPLAALLVVHHDLEREAGAARPLRIRRRLPVADQVARIYPGGGLCPPSDGRSGPDGPLPPCLPPGFRRAGDAGARTRSFRALALHRRPMAVAARLSWSAVPGAAAGEV